MEKKELLDGYVGIKFDAICESAEVPEEVSDLFEDFRYNTLRLKEYNMTPKNGGNISCRVSGGFAISASGCNLGIMEPHEVIYVTSCSVEEKSVHFCGPLKPSSETLMHYLIFRERPDAGAVIHAHDEVATALSIDSGELKETLREEPYGTIALANMAIEAFRDGASIILLKNHGYVATGDNLTEATDIIIDMHKKLMKKI